MKVSIITSCYNREKTIRGAVESVLAQDYPDIEYIIVDGASKDHSVEVIREAIAGHEDQVKFISEPDHGMYEAINKGIRMATGDVIALCHLKVAYLHVDEADENGMESAAIHSSEIHEVVFRIPPSPFS